MRMTLLDRYLSPEIRGEIEQRYYAHINAQAHLDQLAQDETFLDSPDEHVALYADHGVVHVRDVAQQILHVLHAIDGVLVPARNANRQTFMHGYGVIVAYIHDIGMADFSPFGRAMHPEFAAQTVFQADFDPLIDSIWADNWGNLAWRLLNLATNAGLTLDPQLMLRELLALCVCHSKSKAPIEVLNDTSKLRRMMQAAIATPLPLLYGKQRAQKAHAQLKAAQTLRDQDSEIVRLQGEVQEAEAELARIQKNGTQGPSIEHTLQRFYSDLDTEPFHWLTSSLPEMSRLTEDVIDTLRALRCADALRQRGAVLHTSGGYQVFVSQQSANAVFALKKGADEQLFLLEADRAFSSGEANVASSELSPQGDLRISFHRGSFASAGALQRAVRSVAMVINDIQSDVITSFKRAQPEPGLKRADEMRILLEGVDDNSDFAALVAEEIMRSNLDLAGRCLPVPSLQNMSDLERNRYLHAAAPNWEFERRQRFLAGVSASGHKIATMDPEQAFEGVKLADVESGDLLIEAGSPPGFVYIALAEGLRGTPLGGYEPFPVAPHTPLGNTGVIRGAARNATIVAERALQVLMIPKDVYLKRWHSTYTAAEFRGLIEAAYAPDSQA